jgi:hypothetical protein
MGGDDTRKAIVPGGAHLPPYLDPRADQTVVKRVAVDFLDGYLKQRARHSRRFRAMGA